MSSLILVVLLTAANFLYQILTEKDDWNTAAERSFFQAVAVYLAEIFLKG